MIEAAKKCIKDPSVENKKTAAADAAAAYAAAYAADGMRKKILAYGIKLLKELA
jgi:hypothetical protein